MDSFLKDKIPEVLSFDIGTKHMAYCYILNDKLTFNIFDITANNTITRFKKLYNYITEHIPIPKMVVIEKQVSTNEVAMCIMSALVMYYINQNIPVELYDPKKKFKYQGFKNFKGKEHKQLSISYARNILEKTEINKLSDFEKEIKKDDLADCICMTVFTFIESTSSTPKDKILSLIK